MPLTAQTKRNMGFAWAGVMNQVLPTRNATFEINLTGQKVTQEKAMSNLISGETVNSRISTETVAESVLSALGNAPAYLSEIAQMIPVLIGGTLLSIGGFSLISVSIGRINAIYKSRNRGKVFYKFRVKENEQPVHTCSKTMVGDQLVVKKVTYYSVTPEFTVTNLSDFKWKIQKMCVARLPWMKFIRVSILGCNKGYKVKKLKIIRELLFDDGDHLQSNDGCRPTPIKSFLHDSDWKFPVASGDVRTIRATILSSMFLYETTLKDAAKKIGWLKENIDSKRYYWVAMMNDHECLVGDRAECIGKEMRSRRKS